mgnify:CR=1 FL=1
MKSWIERIYYRLKGHSSLYQYYAAVHYSTCETCLQKHGQILHSSDGAPPLHDGCRCWLLEFSLSELDAHKQKAIRMHQKAQRELLRRALFQRACESWSTDPIKASELFKGAAEIDLYLEEVEVFCQTHKASIAKSPESAAKLRDILIRAYKLKFEKEKYKPMPERMKATWQQVGIERLEELFTRER